LTIRRLPDGSGKPKPPAYRWWHFPRMFSENNFEQNAVNIFGNTIAINLIGVPQELNLPVTGFHKVTGTEDRWQNYFAPAAVD